MGIADPERRYLSYPHELSGGMRQRVMIAIAIAAKPRLLIADEPTTALDVTTQAQILELLARLRTEHDMAVLLVSHDFGVIAQVCDRLAVMYGGHIVETGMVRTLYTRPEHPYTKALLESVPSLESAGSAQRRAAIPGQPPELTETAAGLRVRAALPRSRGRSARRSRWRSSRSGPSTRRRVRSGRRAAGGGGSAPDQGAGLVNAAPLLEAEGIVKEFGLRRSRVEMLRGTLPGHRAVDDVSLHARARRDARHRRRLGERQDDARPLPDPARGAGRRARSDSTARTCSRPRDVSCASSAGACRWSSRTRTRRSTRA